MPESAELLNDQDKPGAFREEHATAEKLNEFFALLHAHHESNWGDLNATASSGEDSSQDLPKTEVITNNFKAPTDKTNSNKSSALDNHPAVLKELMT